VSSSKQRYRSAANSNNGGGIDCTPPDAILPGSDDRPILPLHPSQKENGKLHCLKVFTTSAWNPPPPARKLHGDLLYLYVVTLEDKRFHITACTKGFYVNATNGEGSFDPRPLSPPSSTVCCHSLIDLMSQISPGFKRNFSILQKKRLAKHPFERVATPYQVSLDC
jgi:protein TIF31